MNEHDTELSLRGVARREAELEGLKRVVRARGRRRVVAEVAGGLMVAVLVVGTAVSVWVGWGSRSGGVAPGTGGNVAPVAVVEAAAEPLPEIKVTFVSIAGAEVIKTDRSIVSELAPSRVAPVARLDDAGLQKALREAGEPEGLVRVGKRVMTESEFESGEKGM